MLTLNPSTVGKGDCTSIKFKSFQDKYVPFMKGRLTEWNADTVLAVNEIKKRCSRYLDLSNGIGASGHSFGGNTAYHLCQYNEEFTCGINIDGGIFGDYEGQIMTKPFCQIYCTDNKNAVTAVKLNTTAPVYMKEFRRMKHIGFTDAKFFIKSKFMVGSMPPELIYKRLKNIHIRFFDKYLKK